MPHTQRERHIFFLHELAHIDACERFLAENPNVREEGYLIVSLGLELEYALTKRGIPFRSGRAYRPADTSRFRLTQEWAERLDGEEWKWFQYRGVSLAKIFFFSIRRYILYLLYYATILENVLMRHPAARRLIVFPSSHSLQAVRPKRIPPVREQPLLRQELVALVACAELIGAQRGVEVVVPRLPVSVKRIRFRRFIFALKRALMEWGVQLYNAGVALLRPRGTPRILASDYWRNIEPVLSQLPRGELMLFDRSEIAKAGIRNLWRYRIRLVNFNSFSIRNRKRAREEAQRSLKEQWHAIRDTEFPEYVSGEFSLRPLMEEAFEELLTYVVPQTLRDIDGAYALLKTLTPDLVFLRASISEQTHFQILAVVARILDIPSLELQHGLEYLGQSSYSKRHSAEYIAVYGQVVQDEFVALGFPREKIPIVGSPRFDVYKKGSLPIRRDHSKGEGLSVLCVGSLVSVESAQDEYDLEDYYRIIANALEKTPGSSVTIKLRAGPAREDFYRVLIDDIFARVPHTIAQYESLPELFATTDTVVSYYSTFVLEALQFNKPTIVLSAEPREEEMTRFHFTQYAEAGSLITAYTQGELEEAFRSLAYDTTLRDRLASQAEKILARLHLFDGRASERITGLITTLSHKRSGDTDL